jgi:energy-coupling factor transport system ATP-binding protein
MTEPIIICKNLWHTYKGGIVALQNANFSIQPAEIIGVIGQNGSGKTTLVKHFNGLLKPTEGTVTVDGEETTSLKIQYLSKKVGYVFQNPNHQLFARTVELELQFGPENLRLPKEEVIERRDKAIEFFELQEYRHSHPYRISFPLRKLVGMAAIYTMQPKVFILDEPTTGQDNITTQTVYRLIRKLRDQGSTVICVSHDMILLAEVVDRVVVLRDSKIIADATPREVFSDHELMKSTHLTPPQITRLSERLKKSYGLKGTLLSVDEMIEDLSPKLTKMASAEA